MSSLIPSLRLLIRESLKHYALHEATSASPKVIFMAGCAGSGKGSIVKDMIGHIPSLGAFEIINPDYRY